MAADLAKDKFWVNKYLYHDAEKTYYEGMAKVDGISQALTANDKSSSCNTNNTELTRLAALIERLEVAFQSLEKRVQSLEVKCNSSSPAVCPAKPSEPKKKAAPAKDDDDDVDLFASDSEDEDEEAKKIREQRLAEYAAKKSKKPALVAKSNIILDIKPWNDETNMKELEEAVRKVEMDGLVWGASKLVPLVFGIYKLQISCVVEDEKVSVDQLTETLEEIEEYVQSVDIAAFNKV
ncbi:UNVERIFIED_CONTAM: hypothetical protein PYX00_010513 [Menopon gallinae]|uniref:Elongation factor 1-delta n=1 Tax=Menopon gallinae TaxID=328185 RepID=A0AAW2HGQ1_9NEOP